MVHVGGGDTTTLRLLIKAFPWINKINYDLPHVASVAPHANGVIHVGGDMFNYVPKVDVAFLMVLMKLDEFRTILSRLYLAVLNSVKLSEFYY
ncbi:Bergaptol O-methyltransferase [Capsicum baccatum]|uniref:Bergaptol O-methyltransferase n=1 Tax=Capsicum baccatum TaxID=33114 RepID=A0A2G2WWR6_CAPBA|nr:Bergaptol O-methyltransferase [Capsicum baccatum]